MRDFIRLYGRAVRLLAAERRLAVLLTVVNVALAALVFVEPTLFGRIIDVLATGAGRPAAEIWQESLFWLLLWGGLALFAVAANMLVALHADRLAHRRRLAAMADFFTHVLNLPPAFHGGTHSGRLMKMMLTGADHLAALWLGLFREHLATFVALALLLPVALWRNWRLGLLLVVLTVLLAVLVTVVIRRSERSQRAVEGYHADVAARAGDVLGNVVLVQSYVRLRAEVSEFDALTQTPAPGPVPRADLLGDRGRAGQGRLDDHADADLRARHLALHARAHHGRRDRELHGLRHAPDRPARAGDGLPQPPLPAEGGPGPVLRRARHPLDRARPAGGRPPAAGAGRGPLRGCQPLL